MVASVDALDFIFPVAANPKDIVLVIANLGGDFICIVDVNGRSISILILFVVSARKVYANNIVISTVFLPP